MRSLVIENATSRFRATISGLKAKPIFARKIALPTKKGPVSFFQTSWEPSPRDLEKLAAGAPLLVSVMAEEFRPHTVSVGAVPRVDDEPYTEGTLTVTGTA